VWPDGFLKRHLGLRDLVTRLVPASQRRIDLLGRSLNVSQRYEIGLVRLSTLLNLSPMAQEIGAIISLSGLVQPGCTFVDVGANVGLFSVPIASIGEAIGFSVVAIEPNPETAERLRQNLAPFKCASVIQAAASSKTGTAQMGYLAASSATYQLQNGSRDNMKGTASVPTMRLDEMSWPGPWVVKIDVEGHETEVLDGLSRCFKEGIVDGVMVDGFSDQEIPSRLRANGFRLWNGRTLQPYRDGVDFNLLAVSERRGQ
jgi:FkbM family methyltransferase